MPLHSIINTITNTPCVQLHSLTKKPVALFAKLEYATPSQNSADRYVAYLLEQLEVEHDIKKGDTLLSIGCPTLDRSLATLCAQKGLRLLVLLASPPDPLHGKLLRILGVEFVVWPAQFRESPVEQYAAELANNEGWHFLSTHSNQLTTRKYHDSTAFELLNDFSERPIDFLIIFDQETVQTEFLVQHFGRFSPTTKIVLCHLKDDQSAAENEIEEAELQHCFDAVRITHLYISNRVAKWGALMSAQKEGVLTGLQGGAVIAAALAISNNLRSDHSLVCVLPDRIEHYLNNEDFDFSAQGFGLPEVQLSFGDESSDTEEGQLQIQLPTIEVDEEEPLVTDVTQEMLKQFINNPAHPLVMFGLESCEFCWATRKLFKRLAIPVHCVDLDSAAYLPCKLGQKMRATLAAHTDTNNLPQVFLGGEYLGNSLDVFDLVNSRALFRKLDSLGVPHNKVLDIDPYTLLPGWMHEAST